MSLEGKFASQLTTCRVSVKSERGRWISLSRVKQLLQRQRPADLAKAASSEDLAKTDNITRCNSTGRVDVPEIPLHAHEMKKKDKCYVPIVI